MRSVAIGAVLILVLMPGFALGRIGVGVGLGKIQMDEPLRRGGIYELPSLPVLNTGSETADYEVAIEYHFEQPELLPAQEWFVFEPATFTMKPGEVKQIKVLLTLPIEAEPGDYFAYVEARNAKPRDDGTTQIVGAAAAKLYFSVTPSSKWDAIFYRISVLWERFSPWPQVILGVIGVAIFLFVFRLIFRRFFSLNLRLGVKEKKQPQTPAGPRIPIENEEEIIRLAEELKKKREVSQRKSSSRKTSTTKRVTSRRRNQKTTGNE